MTAPLQNHLPRVTSRPFNGEEDFWRVRKLLVDTYPITPLDFNWEMRRWDGERYHNANPHLSPEWSSQMRVWETDTRELVGLAHPDGPGTACLELHPDFRQIIEEEMVAWCEQNLAVETASTGQRALEILVYTYDIPRLRIMEKRGYQKMDDGMVVRRLRLGRCPLPLVEMATGYRLRTTRPDGSDCQGAADLLNAAFNRTFHTAQEYDNFTHSAPCFRHDLNLVAEAPDGTLAALAGVNYEPSIRFAVFEPVCTHPAHRGLGLASALMIEGLHRLKALGAVDVTVGTGMNMKPANALYDAVGFTEIYYQYAWRKTF